MSNYNMSNYSVSDYMLILSSGPTESRFQQAGNMARELQGQGHKTTLFLVQNATLAARQSPAGDSVRELTRQGIMVLADDFSLKERGIKNNQLAPEITPASLDCIIDSLAAGHKVLWQ